MCVVDGLARRIDTSYILWFCCLQFVGTPAEVALVRMTADGRLPEAEKRNYRSVFDALARISRQEGVFMLWRGAIPTMGRSMVVNAAQLASYSQAKELLLNSGKFAYICHQYLL